MRRTDCVAALILVLGLPLGAWAAEKPCGTQACLRDIVTRSTMTGSWGGLRDDLEKKGVKIDASLTQVEQGVVDGGKNGSWEYGGRGLLEVHLDSGKLGLWPGGFLMAELEGNWADSVNGKTGGLSPANTNQVLPLPLGDNVALPQLAFAQFVSPYAGAIVGKLDTMIGDANEFAHGKGDTQFLNLAFNINPVLLSVPYSTLGTGAILLPTADPEHAVVTLFVLSANGKASTAGFNDIHGAVFSGEGRVRTNFFGLTGHQVAGAIYSNKRYTSVDQRLGFAIDNRSLELKSDTWAVNYNFDQFLYETDKAAGRGIGVFGRFGASAGNPNPMEFFYSIGFGGKGMIPSRQHDRFGLGYYYTSVNSPTFQRPLSQRSFLRDEWGFEAFYNLAVTPWLLLTPDIQVIGPAQKRQFQGTTAGEHIGTATVLGLRFQIIL